MSYRRYEDSDRSPRAGQKRWHDKDDRYGDRGHDDRSPQKRRRSEHGENGSAPPLHSIFLGEVATVKDYGLFVKIEDTKRQGLVHKSQISLSRIDDASEMYSIGDMVYCKVISIERDGDRIGLAMKHVNQKTGQDLDPENTQQRSRGDFNRSPRGGQKRWNDRDDDRYGDTRHRDERSPVKRRQSFTEPAPPLYMIFQGEVATTKDYGLFVRIPDTRRQGLVHKSQISLSRIDDASDMYSVGETVYCKVISIDEDGEKIALGMKNVNQTTGEDMDPNNVHQGEDDKKRRQWKHLGRPKIELDAAYDTVCRKCGGKGHLAHECYKARGDNSYELIGDLDQYMEDVGRPKHAETGCRKKKKKEKKHKKDKKRSRHRDSYSSSETDSDRDSHKKHKKKKQRRDSSTSQSDSNSDARTKPKKQPPPQRQISSDVNLYKQTKLTKRPPYVSESDSDEYSKTKQRNKQLSLYDAELEAYKKMRRMKKQPSPSESGSDRERQIVRKKKQPSFSETESHEDVRHERKQKSHRSSTGTHQKHKDKPQKKRRQSYSSHNSAD